MDFTELVNVHDADFDLAMEIYIEAFPANERHPIAVIRERVEKGRSRIFIGRHDDQPVFMALLWPLKHTEFILLDYMATSPPHRGKQIGSAFLQYLRVLLQKDEKYLVLEVEHPEYGDNGSQRLRRVSFYRRQGAQELSNVSYLLPPLQGVHPTEMMLMIFPSYRSNRMEKSVVRALIIQIYKELYDRDEDDLLLQNSLSTLNDFITLT